MLNLAIECSGISGSVALFQNNQAIEFQDLPANSNSVRNLASTIDRILKSNNPETHQGMLKPDFLSITQGPGSFTGLRVGLATAKMLGLAWKIPIVGVDSLAAVALQTSQATQLGDQPCVIVAAMNAFRKQVFAGAWYLHNDSLALLATSQVVDAKAWVDAPLESLKMDARSGSELSSTPKLVTGPGLSKYPPSESQGLTIADPSAWLPRARAVATLGWEAFQQGRAVAASELQANYVRASAAEEKLG